VLAFPCNQFGAQAPCSSECEREYMSHKLNFTAGTSTPGFTVLDKVDVNGPGTLEAYAVLKTGANRGHDAGFDIMWNYEKFVVDANGIPVSRFASSDSPLKAEADIRQLLGLPREHASDE